MTSRLQQFSMAAVLATIVLAVVLALVYRATAIHNLTEARVERNSELTLSLSAVLTQEIRGALAAAPTDAGTRILTDAETEAISAGVAQKIQLLDVYRVNIFSVQGTVIFSTDPVISAAPMPANPGVVLALTGERYSEIIKQGASSHLGNTVERNDLVSTYVPVRGDAGEVIGVFEVYTEISPFIAQISETQTKIITLVIVVMSLFCGFFVFLYWRAESRSHDLEDERDLMQYTIDSIKDPAVVIDTDYHISIMNKAARSKYGHLVNRDKEVLCHQVLQGCPQLCGTPDENCSLLSGEGRSNIVEREGKQPIEFTATPLVDKSGNTTAVVMVEREIGEREQAATKLQQEKEEAETASRIKSQFVATMSHEIRTPMNAVLGMTDVLNLTNLTRKQRGYIQTIQSSGDMLLNLLDNVLDFSRLESGVLEIQKQEFKVVNLLERVLEIMGHTASSKKLELIGNLNNDFDLRVLADERRLRQVLVNLVSNAIKFTDDGEISIDINVIDRDDRGVQLQVSVSDTGAGVDDDIREHLFTPFVSSDRPESSQQYGSGLGLTICQQLIEHMGGNIEIRQRTGGGTVASFSVPVTCVEPAVDYDSGYQSEAPKRRVLILHGNETAANSISEYLRRWDIESQQFDDGDAAMRQLCAATGTEEPFDAAIVDATLTADDGLAFVRRLRGATDTKALHVVLLTSILEPLGIGEVSALGCTRCINKPILPLELRYNLLRSMDDEFDSPEPVAEDLDSMGGGKSLQILIAEDNPVNSAVLQSMLRSEGYSADIVVDGPSVLTAVKNRHYDLLLMDCQMPGMDGDVVTRELRRNPELYRAPTVIVAVTADASEEHRAKCIEAGMDEFVTKPIRLDGLRSGLERWTAAADRRNIAKDNSKVAMVRDELIAKTAQTDEVFLREYIQLFLIDANVRLRIIANAVDEADTKIILRESHSLKGACLEFGAERMARYCETLASAVKHGNMDETANEMQKLGNEFSRIRPVFESVRSSLH